jgi:signal transduction histidine kinase
MPGNTAKPLGQPGAHAGNRELVTVALRNTHNAARLVRSLGDLAQLDEPTFTLQTSALDLAELLNDVVDAVRQPR